MRPPNLETTISEAQHAATKTRINREAVIEQQRGAFAHYIKGDRVKIKDSPEIGVVVEKIVGCHACHTYKVRVKSGVERIAADRLTRVK
jgi:hypothetical protein